VTPLKPISPGRSVWIDGERLDGAGPYPLRLSPSASPASASPPASPASASRRCSSPATRGEPSSSTSLPAEGPWPPSAASARSGARAPAPAACATMGRGGFPGSFAGARSACAIGAFCWTCPHCGRAPRLGATGRWPRDPRRSVRDPGRCRHRRADLLCGFPYGEADTPRLDPGAAPLGAQAHVDAVVDGSLQPRLAARKLDAIAYLRDLRVLIRLIRDERRDIGRGEEAPRSAARAAGRAKRGFWSAPRRSRRSSLAPSSSRGSRTGPRSATGCASSPRPATARGARRSSSRIACAARPRPCARRRRGRRRRAPTPTSPRATGSTRAAIGAPATSTRGLRPVTSPSSSGARTTGARSRSSSPSTTSRPGLAAASARRSSSACWRPWTGLRRWATWDCRIASRPRGSTPRW